MTSPRATAARNTVRDAALKAGINEVFIGELVQSFYARIRAHKQLGPIFDAVIDETWPEHLQKMKEFWSSVALHTGRYNGKPVEVHRALTMLQPSHFGWAFGDRR
jgi:hemoglobin